jgi:gas vesicle protein
MLINGEGIMEWLQQLAGVIVGGLIASFAGWLVARRIFTWERKTALNINRKNEIYSPLYAELQQVKSKLHLLPLCPEITIDSRSPWANNENNPHFLVWSGMNTTARHLDVPQELHGELDKYETFLNKYNHALRDIDSELTKALPPIRKNHDVQPDIYEDGPSWRACLLKGELGYDSQYFSMSFNQAQDILADLNRHFETSGLLQMTKDTLAEIESETNQLVRTLEQRIRQIITKYEERSEDKNSGWTRLKTFLTRKLW